MGQQTCKSCGLPTYKSSSEEVLKFLAQVSLFKQLPEELRPALAAISEKVDYEPGTKIITQGEDGNEFFIIFEGHATVCVNNEQVAILKTGDFFGERALLRDEPRAATIAALSKVTTIKISRANFQSFGLHDRLRFAHRKAVGGGEAAVVMVQTPSKKTPAERALMHEALKANPYLQGIMNLREDHLQQIIELAWKENVPAGMVVISEGDLSADYFYIVQEGSFGVSVQDKGGTSIQGAIAQAQSVGTIGKGGSFGELALLYMAPRAATVRATESSVVWVIDRKNFKEILAKSHADIALEHIKHLNKVEILAPLQLEEKQALARALMEMLFSKDETIFRQGEKGDAFYILVEGEVAVIEDGQEVRRLEATSDKASFFGERALMESTNRTATIKVVSETAKALTVDRGSFNLLLGPLQELKQRGKLDTSSKKRRSVLSQISNRIVLPSDRKFGVIKLKDLEVVGLLGCGGFGAVHLVEHRETKVPYAMKILSKGYVVKAGMQQSIISEKNVQLMCDSPFIIKLFETYSEEQYIRFLLEPALGGELYATYSRRGLHGKEGHARFYVSGVVLAFQHLHSRKVIYRDLKPENLLLTEQGRVKLTDMGLAKVTVGKTYTTCGTPDYFSPEMVASCGHTSAVDWWTLGILTFELMTGHPPFEAATPMQTYQKVANGIQRVKFPSAIKGACEDLVKSLCCKNPIKRLPMKSGGIDNIKQHPWMAEFDWVAMEQCTMDPPYVPHVSNGRDLANFSARAEDLPPHVPYRDDKSGWDKDFATSS